MKKEDNPFGWFAVYDASGNKIAQLPVLITEDYGLHHLKECHGAGKYYNTISKKPPKDTINV